MMPRPPKSCPYLGFWGESHCINEDCGYYEEREPSASYKRKVAVFKALFGEEG